MLSLFEGHSQAASPKYYTRLHTEILYEHLKDMPVVISAEARDHDCTTPATVECEHLRKNAVNVDTTRQTTLIRTKRSENVELVRVARCGLRRSWRDLMHWWPILREDYPSTFHLATNCAN